MCNVNVVNRISCFCPIIFTCATLASAELATATWLAGCLSHVGIVLYCIKTYLKTFSKIWFPISGVTIGWTGWTMSRGPRVPGAPEFQTKKNISLASQSKFDLIHYSYSYYWTYCIRLLQSYSECHKLMIHIWFVIGWLLCLMFTCKSHLSLKVK